MYGDSSGAITQIPTTATVSSGSGSGNYTSYITGIRAMATMPLPTEKRNEGQRDVDVLIVSPSLAYAEVFGALESASGTLGRSVNPALYTPEEFERRVAQDNAFINRVMQQPKIWLIGKENPVHEPSP